MTSPTLPLLPLDVTISLRIARRLRNEVALGVHQLPKPQLGTPAREEAVVDQTRLPRCLGTRSSMRFSPEERPNLILDLSPHFSLFVRSVDSFSPLLW